jgi:3-oxoacyl-[acyl-carrier protein] reductase
MNNHIDTFYHFHNQVCLITGAGSESGIGFAAAKILGQLGATVLITGTTERIFLREQELRKDGISAVGYVIDLTDRIAVKGLIAEILATFGTLHVLINNAGMTQVGQEEEFTPFYKLSDESFETAINRNLMTCYNTTRAVIGTMMDQKYGRIVNVSSTTGPLGSNPGESGYGAAKAAILGMSKGIAMETAKHNITVNNVLPGWVATGSQTKEEAFAGMHTPMGRSGRPEEIAHMIVFLATRVASYITGQDFVVDGGNFIVENKGGSYYDK